MTPLSQLGMALFFDTNLSLNGNQSCSSCHDPSMGFASPDANANAGGGVVEGSIPGRFGNRRPPVLAYGGLAPVLHHGYEDGEILFVGGDFLDGRATGNDTGTALADQAMMPFMNPLEMAMNGPACVVWRACQENANDAFPAKLESVLGEDICKISFPQDIEASCGTIDTPVALDEDEEAKVDGSLKLLAMAIASFERSPDVNAFSSRFDKWLEGKGTLSPEELAGFEVFEREDKGNCAACHVLDMGPEGQHPLLTDFTYDNIGVPRNPDNPYYGQTAFNPEGKDYVDPGLGATLAADPVYASYAPDVMGAQKVPTLRNLTKGATPETPRAYMHNGYFKTLEGVVAFYNKRDVWPRCESDLVPEAEAMKQHCWPSAEFPDTMNTEELGDLELTDAEEAELVAFLKTLDDE